jgi:hypothetical protein
MSDLAYQEIEKSSSNVVHGKFSDRDTETARSLLRKAIEAYQLELKAIKDPAPANTWVIYPVGRKPQKRIEVSLGKVRQHTITAKQAAEWEQARVRREKKQELTVLIDELYRVLHRGH